MALHKAEEEEKLGFLLTRLQLNVNKPQDFCCDTHGTKIQSGRNSSMSITASYSVKHCRLMFELVL